MSDEPEMVASDKPLRVLHSFPHRLGRARIDLTAWCEIEYAAKAGAEMIVLAGDVVRPFNYPVRIHKTLTWGKVRLPFRIFGTRRISAMHDLLVAKRLPSLRNSVDIIHAWPMAALRTIRVARQLGIPVALERCNAHTRFAYEVVQKECEKLGITMPPGHEHAYNEDILGVEEQEYDLADCLLCPSDFVARTFQERGYPPERLTRHQYGFDEKVYSPGKQNALDGRGLTALFVGGCAPRKGLHYALEAWLKSPAHESGRFLIAGAFIPGYAEKLSGMLSHPSVKVLGHRGDAPELMRQSDLFVLPSIEEGSALVTSEARGSGCVLVVSDATGAYCQHMENALVHKARDVEALTEHITMLDQNRSLLMRLREASLATSGEITWTAAGSKLLTAYREVTTLKVTRWARPENPLRFS